MDSCYDELDCPRGTLCAKSDESRRGVCRLPSDILQTSQSALLDGFGVAEMPAELRMEAGLELAWTAPEGTRLVNCVLFACPPAFRIRTSASDGDEAETWAEPLDRNAVEIANYDRCALASERSPLTEGLFNLRERDNEHLVPSPLRDNVSVGKDGQAKLCRGYGCPPVTELFAGCWAYDDTTIIAATRLFPIKSTLGLYNYHGAFARDSGRCSRQLYNETTIRILEDNFRSCLLDPDASDGTTDGDTTGGTGDTTDGDSGSDPNVDGAQALRYGVCVCSTVDEKDPLSSAREENGVCADLDPCRRPCLCDGDCSADPSLSTCSRSVSTLGYCVGAKCVGLPSY